ncbi:MAG: benzoyl-CoA-dihydrodiol lyase [Rhodospirillaceae bacterium]|nr:benzoyl-CoA-dihydrodiol lyase [Rhodospirillaceae bacterium]|tara:strand:- start:11245 stop:12954 length:1710 start_codon:yes stop_codon:yes gene_type:complete
MAPDDAAVKSDVSADGDGEPRVNFATSPDQYKHWNLTIDGNVARLAMAVDENATLKPGYELKLNSYDLGVDIELYDAIQRLRFEHPEVGCVILCSDHPAVFCAGANIRMLGMSTHDHKVNFCKFTNETRNGIEDATEHSQQKYICAINGTAAGGGYELALATDYIMLIDDGASTVSLPELPLLAVLPGTGGLTRLVDKRKVRHDRSDVFCTTTEGMRGKRAVDWNLIDEIVPRSKFHDAVAERAAEFAAQSDRPKDAKGVEFTPLNVKDEGDKISYDHLSLEFDRGQNLVTFIVNGPKDAPPADAAGVAAQGVDFWPLALARELDAAIVHLRVNENQIGTWVFQSEGDNALVEAYDNLLEANQDDWLVRETTLYLKRTLKRVDVSARSLIALVEPGSCFSGTLLEFVLVADRSYMLDGQMEGSNLPAPTIRLTGMNFGPYPMSNGLTRLETRLFGEPDKVDAAKELKGEDLEALDADDAGLVTFAPDDIDWEDEVRLAIEERASFSPDGLTGLEANLRFAGPETMETKIFGRLSAWQNWIFQRPNAAGPEGALKLYGTGQRSEFDKKRV